MVLSKTVVLMCPQGQSGQHCANYFQFLALFSSCSKFFTFLLDYMYISFFTILFIVLRRKIGLKSSSATLLETEPREQGFHYLFSYLNFRVQGYVLLKFIWGKNHFRWHGLSPNFKFKAKNWHILIFPVTGLLFFLLKINNFLSIF